MIRNRRNSQKPDPRLIETFRERFSDACAPNASSGAEHNSIIANNRRPSMKQEEVNLSDGIGSSMGNHLAFPPSTVDPSAISFSSMADSHPAHFAPTPGILGIPYHNQAGSLLTPTGGFGSMTSGSGPGAFPAAGTLDFGMYNHPFNHHLDSNFGNYGRQPHSYHPPAAFVHQNPGYDSPGSSTQPSPVSSTQMNGAQLNGVHMNGARMNGTSVGVSRYGHSERPQLDMSPPPGLENFRFQAILDAPTAMLKEADEVPVSYLNKNQAYKINITDSQPPDRLQGVKYRTYIRITFESEEQRSRAAACWQLWKEGRGAFDAFQKKRDLLALEYVDPNEGGDPNGRHQQVQLQSTAFDGFSVIWEPHPMTGEAKCTIQARFFFLSTDFSHSKGVKGIPVRLCAKTEVVSPDLEPQAELCYCKVKLFRDHGAERKTTNDRNHMKKAIEKVQAQILNPEMGPGSKKNSISGKPGPIRTPKMPRHKRTLSNDSQKDLEMRTADELHTRLDTLRALTNSIRPTSALNLKGDPEDDPDIYPIHLDPDVSSVLMKFPNFPWKELDD